MKLAKLMNLKCIACMQILVLSLMTFSGCSYLPWPETFGEVSGSNSLRGLNGVGVHREMWESTGAKILTPQKLSPRLDSIDTIVLVGSSYQPPGTLARDWLERWLSKKQGRTVVYFGRDFDANLLYRQETLDEVDANQFERAQTQLSSSRAADFTTRAAQIREDTFCRWFFLRVSARPTEHTKFSGAWSSELAGLEGVWPTGMLLEPPDKKLKNKKPSWVTGTKTGLVPAKTFVLNQSDDEEQKLGDKEVQRSIWKADELEDSKEWDEEWKLAGEAKILLESADGTPLVHSINHAKFRGSKILIVTNGAPFLNGSVVKPLHRKVSELVIEECLPAKRVAMIQFDESGLLLSNIESGSETDFGIQLLTVWPLSAITMHAAFLGIIAFAVLLPILGRPQSLARRSVTDFGLHVEAMGRMLSESRDMVYGLRAIHDYFTKVRRESPPSWLGPMTAQEDFNRQSLEAAKQEKLARKNKTAVASPATSALPPEHDDVVVAEVVANASDKSKPTNATPPDPVS